VLIHNSRYRKSAEIAALHEALIASVAGYRINPGNPYEEGYFTPYTAEQRQNAKETGYDLARNLYRPHITLTCYKDGGIPDAFPALSEAKLSFDLDKVCVCQADDNGAQYERICEFHIR
jgi:2'-5' RNA ligase